MIEAAGLCRWMDGEAIHYRLDLQIGLPLGRLDGPLEWQLGDAGLCRHPDHHPYLVLAELDATGWGDQQRVMREVARITVESAPIQISVQSAPGILPSGMSPRYRVIPSPGLCSFLYRLSLSCPLIADGGSLAYCIGNERSGICVSGPPAVWDDQGRPPPHRCHEGGSPGGSYRGTAEARRAVPPAILAGKAVAVDILRFILRKEGVPVAEFDLAGGEWTPLPRSLHGKNARESLRKYRIAKGYQMTRPAYCRDPQIHVISDLHLGHANGILRYKRPFLFPDTREMDRVLIRNWNWTVKKDDMVIFLGDLSFMSTVQPESYLKRLSGGIFYLEGNHDPYYPYMSRCLLMRYCGVPYLFIHDPEELARPFPGWVIHGHIHNMDVSRYPFFDPLERRVNVSAEMIGYSPIPLEEIHRLVLGGHDVLEFRDLRELQRGGPAPSGEPVSL